MFREVVDSLWTHRDSRIRVIRSATRVGKTTAVIGIALYNAFYLSQHVLIILHNLDTAHDTMGNIQAIIDASPHLAKLVGGRKSDSRKDYIRLLTGIKIRVVTAASGNSFRAFTAGCVVCDEVDAYPLEMKGEGSPLALAVNRTATYGQTANIWICSTPTDEDNHIAKEYNKSWGYHWTVPCPSCHKLAKLAFRDIRFPDKLALADLYDYTEFKWECPSCHGMLSEKEFRKAREAGCFQDGPDNEFKSKHQIGFHVSGLMSIERPLKDIVREFIQSNGDFSAKRNFTNNIEGETFTQSRQKVTAKALQEFIDRSLKAGECPEQTLAINWGIDVGYSGELATHRFHVVAAALTPKRNVTFLINKYIEGERGLLDFIRATSFKTPTGRVVKASFAWIDSGWGPASQYIYDLCKHNPRYVPLKGDAGMDILDDGKSDDGTLTVKKINKQRCLADWFGMIENKQVHFSPFLTDDYYQMLQTWCYDIDLHKYVEIKASSDDHYLDATRYVNVSFLDDSISINGYPLKNVLDYSIVASHFNGSANADAKPIVAVSPNTPAKGTSVSPNHNFRSRFSSYRR